MSTSAADISKNARGRPSDSPEVRISKTLSYILRHGASKEGLIMRPDGYIRLDDLLARPKLKGVDLATIQKIVADNDKQRYQLLLGNAPSSASEALVPSATTEGNGTWWIRANQGHTLKVESLELTPITSADHLPVAVHGTTRAAWNLISKVGLSRMKRNHIHLATGLPSDGVKSGMRPTSTVLVYVSVPKAMAAGIKFFLSSNGVVLTEGDPETGLLKPEFFERVEFVAGGGGGGQSGRGDAGSSSRGKRGRGSEPTRGRGRGSANANANANADAGRGRGAPQGTSAHSAAPDVS